MTVRQIQLLLAYLGYYGGSVDGIWGGVSQAACLLFQKQYGDIQVDGVAGPETQKALKQAVLRDMFYRNAKQEDPGESGTFWEEIQYFTREEFRCRCGGKYCSGFPAEPDEMLVRLADDLRRQTGKPAHLSSGLRCPAWNAIQGGVANSRHLQGKAMDFYLEGVSGSKLLSMAQADPRTRYAYIIEGQYVHVDVN